MTDSTSFTKEVRTAALEYAALDYRLIPVHGIVNGLCTCGLGPSCRSPGKHPLSSGWAEQATSDPETIADWPWEQGINLGLVPGEQYTILDFDGPKGQAMMGKLMSWCPALQDDHYPIFRTGSGGYHLIGAGKSPNGVKTLDGMDIRGAGGMAVIPPSRHFSGGRYEIIRFLPEPIPLFPQEILDITNKKGPIPPELQLPELVTMDDLRIMAKRSGKYQTAFKAVIKGEPFADPGTRDTILTGMVGTIVSKHPKADPAQTAALFVPSLEAMATSPGAPTLQDVISKLQRFQQRQSEQQAHSPLIAIGVNIVEMGELGVDAIAQLDPPVMFRRGGRLCHVSHNTALPELASRADEAPVIQNAEKDVVRAALSTSARWMKRNVEGMMVEKLPPAEVVGYITAIGEWSQIPYLEAVVSGPFLRSDGTIYAGGGYDRSMGIMSVKKSSTLELVPKEEALQKIAEVFTDFPFREGHYSTILAALLTGAGRYAFPGPCPMFLIDANTRGAGKTLCANAASMIINPGGAQPIDLGRDNDEDRKQLTSAAMSGAQTLLIDNISGKFGTSMLCAALTLHNGIWADRLLGKNTVWSGPFRPIFFGTGNNVILRADMSRRVCYCRLESPLERPELRTDFQNPSLMGFVYENREYLFWCALSILKQFVSEGYPGADDLEPWGGYEGWSKLVRGAVVWCGYPDPTETRGELTFSDEEHDNGQLLTEGLHALFAEHGGSMKCSEIQATLYKLGIEAEREKYSDLREAIDACMPPKSSGTTPTAQSLGRIFRRFRGRVFNNLAIRNCGAHGRYWKVVKVDED